MAGAVAADADGRAAGRPPRRGPLRGERLAVGRPRRRPRRYAELEGKTLKQAQRRTVELLAEAGALIGQPRPITHFVKFYERGERPLEIVSSPQWYVHTMAIRDRLLERGRELQWHPEFMQARYEAWVEGLTGDWNISRQRFFGVPFPVWYRLDEAGSRSRTSCCAASVRCPSTPPPTSRTVTRSRSEGCRPASSGTRT